MHERPLTGAWARDERGIALVTTLLVIMLMAALLVGFTTVAMSDQKYRVIDRDRTQAFYAAHSGLEKLNVDLSNLFFSNPAPTAADLAALATQPPTIPNVTFLTLGNAAYGVKLLASPDPLPITTGPYQGLVALKKIYQLDATARTSSGGETHLTRKIETVSIPVFQFGMFSEVDQSFFAGPDFDFGGRIHTNGNIFLAQGGGNTLTLSGQVTAVGEVVRKELANGMAIATTTHTGTVEMAKAPNSFRDLLDSEASVLGGPTSGLNPSWNTISLGYYNGYIRNGLTGAKPLNLSVVTTGGATSDIVLRPKPNEHVTNSTLFNERLFKKTSLRILLSDTAADITNLPGITPTAPVQLDGNWATTPPAGYGPLNATHPPVALSPGPNTAVLTAAVGTGTNQSINVAAMPPYYQLPVQLMVRKGATAYVVSCQGRTKNQFLLCTPAPVTVNTPATIEALVPTTNGNVLVVKNLTASWGVTQTTITVNNGDTSAFVHDTVWVQNADGSDVLVTCGGYVLNRFDDCTVPTALQNNAVLTTGALTNAGVGLLGGYLKIEVQDTNSVWRDVTTEVLNWGFSAPNLVGQLCPDPTPNAIIRLQRLRDNRDDDSCFYPSSQRAEDYWPNVVFDAREAVYRDSAANNLLLGGLMHYVTLDVKNLSSWLKGSGVYGGGTGKTAKSENGYSVYFSDRRNNRNLLNQETGEFGFEDVVNPTDASGTPNALLDVGEDVNQNGTLESYGQFPSYAGARLVVPPGSLAPLDGTARPTTLVRVGTAMVNRAILFRRALKLVNGGVGNLVAPGLTIAAENPVYIHGSWNASQSDAVGEPHVATSVIADAVTILSDAWSDITSFDFPYSPASRTRSGDSYYRVAIIAGKNQAFPRPLVGNPPNDFGTDGGAHNFLRMLEGGGGKVHYRGSIATFYYARQAVGIYKCCSTVYDAPVRNFHFDDDFLDPAKLPPQTPMFRDTNALGFSQEIRPGQ